jgi:hypothetical protein
MVVVVAVAPDGGGGGGAGTEGRLVESLGGHLCARVCVCVCVCVVTGGKRMMSWGRYHTSFSIK